jgi:NADH-quinone oxidoreductase subunit N
MRLDWSLLAPEYVLAGWAALLVLMDLFLPRLRKEWLGYLGAAGALAAIGTSLIWLGDEAAFGELLEVDSYTTFFRLLFQGIALVVCLISARYVGERLRHHGEYYALVLLSALGATYMAAAQELLSAYIALELSSFSLYVLASFAKTEVRSNEGGLKYMLLGAFSSAILLYGLSLLYATAGTTQYDGIRQALAGELDGVRSTALLGLVLLVAGLGFKVAAVPFHMWTPDAYEGAPLPVTALISALSKAAGFALFVKLFVRGLLPLADDWQPLLAGLAAATMLLGNLVAIQQRNIKRLLAYSSIGQVGYLLAGVVALSPERPDAASAILFHLAGYVISNLAAFACAIVYYNWTGKEDIYDYRGLAERAPFLALALSAALFSLAGMPLFAGFVTKFVLFQAIAQEGFLWLAGVGVLTSFISLYYYLMVMKQMYLGEPEAPGRFPTPWREYVAVAALLAGVFLVGLAPLPLLQAAEEAASMVYRDLGVTLLAGR